MIGENKVRIIPEYWQKHLEEKINLINEIKRNVGQNAASFIVISDIHWACNAKLSPELLKVVMKKCDIPFFVNCGDTITGFPFCEKQEIFDELNEYRQAFSEVESKCLMIEGNHDRAYSPHNAEKSFSMNISKEEFVKNAFILPYSQDNLYRFVDDEINKVRYVILDTHDIPYTEEQPKFNAFISYYMRQEQFDWLTNYALILPDDDWEMVLFSHENSTVFNKNHLTKTHDGLTGVLESFNKRKKFIYEFSLENYPEFNVNINADFSNYKGHISLWISGHEHGDKMVKSKGITSISVMNDSIMKNTEWLGTIDEQAFDVFIIDKKQKKCFAVRIGRGENREFNLN